MVTLVNRVKVATTTTGTGAVDFGPAESGYQSPSDAGLLGDETVRYVIEDGDAWEIGSGGINGSVTQMSRTLLESSTGSKLSLSGDAVVFITAAAEDIQQPPSEGAFVDGDKTKLDGIEANATADQTAGEIKTAYESNANTNAFTDSEQSKLSGIEAGADVTDATNVTAAGALMDSEVTNLAQVKAFDSSDYATAAQGSLADSATQPGDNISTLTNDAGYTTNVGDITGVTAGTGLSGGGASGSVTLNVDLSELADMTATMVGTDQFIVLDAGADRRKAANEIGLSVFNNDAGYTTNVGDITGVTAGNALTGGGTSGTVTINHADTSSQGSVNNSGTTVIQDVTLDTYGHVTALGSTTLSIPNAANNATITLSAGSQLTGGGNFTTDQSFNETITFNHGDTSALSGTYGSTADGTKIDTITVDENGHVTAVSTGATGDILGVTAGTGLTGGGTSGTVTLNGVTQTEATWEAGTSTSEGVVSPAKVKAAIEALGGGGTEELIASATASSSSSLDFTGFDDSKYDIHKFVFLGLKPASGVDLMVLVSTNGGSSYTSTGLSYALSAVSSNDAGDQSGVNLFLTKADVDPGASDSGMVGDLQICVPRGTEYTPMSWRAGYQNENGNANYVAGAAVFKNTTRINAVRFQANFGNIASGSIKMYGLLK